MRCRCHSVYCSLPSDACVRASMVDTVIAYACFGCISSGIWKCCSNNLQEPRIARECHIMSLNAETQYQPVVLTSGSKLPVKSGIVQGLT